jgi:hypothetical protein
MANRQSLNNQHLAFLRQQGTSALAHQVLHLVRQDSDQQRQSALLQAALEAHLQRQRLAR